MEILKLGLVKILNFKFSGDADVWFRFFVDAQLRFWRWNVIKICVWTCAMTLRGYFGKMNSTLGSVVPLAIFCCRFHFLRLFDREKKYIDEEEAAHGWRWHATYTASASNTPISLSFDFSMELKQTLPTNNLLRYSVLYQILKLAVENQKIRDPSVI